MLLQVYEEVKAELKLRGGYIMTPEECKKAGNTIIKEGRLNAGTQAWTSAVQQAYTFSDTFSGALLAGKDLC
jgi:hypothetical protein